MKLCKNDTLKDFFPNFRRTDLSGQHSLLLAYRNQTIQNQCKTARAVAVN